MCGFFFHTGFQDRKKSRKYKVTYGLHFSNKKNPRKPSVLGLPRKRFNADDRT